MANKNNRTCFVCSRSYRFCPTCAEYESWPYWHVMFHDANCHDIWYVLSDFENGVITKEEAIEKMNHLDASVIDKNNKNVMDSYNKLFGLKKEDDSLFSKPEHVLSVSEELKAKEEKPKIQPKTRASKAKSAIAE